MRLVLAIMIASLLLALPAVASDPFSMRIETYRVRAVSIEGGQVSGGASFDIRRKGDRAVLIEDRDMAEGIRQVFTVELNPDTLIPYSWKKEHTEDGKTTRYEIDFFKDHLEARIFHGEGKPKVKTVARPGTPFSIEPLMKFFLAKRIESGKAAGKFQMVVLTDSFFKAFEVKALDLGVERITVPAGTFQCRKLKVKSLSSVLNALMPPGDMYFDLEGTHPFVMGTGKAHRLAPEMRTELVSYEAK